MAKGKTKLKSISKVKAKVKTKIETKSKAKSKVKTKAKLKPKMKNKIKVKTQKKILIKSKAKVQKKVKIKTNTAKTKPNTKAKTKIIAKTKTKVVKPKAVTNDPKFWSNFLTPLDDRLVVEVRDKERKTAGGLIIPDTSEMEGNYEGVVLAVGRGHLGKKGKIKNMAVKPGDQILFSEHSGAKVTILNKDVRIIRESEVLGIIEE